MKLLITRHPITKHNEQGVIQGKEHGSITEIGYKQIKKLIQRLEKENITRIISSDALRCKITVKQITKEIKIPFEYTGLLDEKSYGDFTGKKASEVDKKNLIGNSIEEIKYPGGENLIEVRKRARRFFKQLIEKHKDTQETILIVSHGIFLQILIGYLLGMNIQDSRYKLLIDHCSLSEMDINKKYESGYRMIFLNENEFLRN